MLSMTALAIIGVAIFAAAVLLTLLVRPRGTTPGPRTPLPRPAADRPTDDRPGGGDGGPGGRRPRAVVVVQPVKYPAGSPARRAVTEVCSELGWAEPEFVETTVADPGGGQAREAARSRPEVVLVLGGDGTVRAVAEGLTGTDVPLGLLPGGTGNLFARQLELPLGDIRGSTRRALLGADKKVDVGRLSVDGREERVFLVMAGLGFDAEMMAGAPAAIKDRVGPLAYVVSGLRRLKGESILITMTFDDHPPETRRVRMVVVGNCGTLIGGIVLIPHAEVDDGNLDVLTLSPNGIVGWLGVGLELLSGRHGRRRRVMERKARSITIECDSPQAAQMDGDTIGQVTVLRTRVDREVLVIRTPDGKVPHRGQRVASVAG